MERGRQGQHTAATKERSLLCVISVARHDALPKSILDAGPGLPKWTWLRLTPFQATIFGWTVDTVGGGDEEAGEEGFPVRLPDGPPSRVRFVTVYLLFQMLFNQSPAYLPFP